MPAKHSGGLEDDIPGPGEESGLPVVQAQPDRAVY